MLPLPFHNQQPTTEEGSLSPPCLVMTMMMMTTTTKSLPIHTHTHSESQTFIHSLKYATEKYTQSVATGAGAAAASRQLGWALPSFGFGFCCCELKKRGKYFCFLFRLFSDGRTSWMVDRQTFRQTDRQHHNVRQKKTTAKIIITTPRLFRTEEHEELLLWIHTHTHTLT